MSLSLLKWKKKLRTTFLLFILLFLGILWGYLSNHVFSENARFEKFAGEIFQKEVSGNTLTLHYSLADPESQGIRRPSPTLGEISTDTEETRAICQQYETKLKDFSYSKLSTENQMTLDMLLLYFHTQSSPSNQILLGEMLSPSLGIQAQLPVLLAEYAFYDDQDITDYLNLLTSVRPYFQSIIAFQQEKSAAGLFMSDTTLNRVLEQCSAFIQNPDSNYMIEIFAEKIDAYGKFSSEEQQELISAHKEIVQNSVIPAYQELMAGLSALRGTGKNGGGLAGLPGGREYYEFLLKSQVGTYTPVEKIELRLAEQLSADCDELQRLFTKNPALLTKLTDGTDLPSLSPEKILQILQQKITDDFPALENISYEIRNVHESMADYLSPAFYLTPPLDTGSPNIIYINSSGRTSQLELFTTLAHEGFPGHLYQTAFLGRQNPCSIRYLINSSGYVEGWATYVESYAFQYASSLLEDDAASDITRASFLNRSINLCISSLLDIGIHYRGWNEAKSQQFLRNFGIQDETATKEIFQYIVETPVNYLKYYWGYLNFLDLKTEQQALLGDSFDLKTFHEQILKIGPLQFPVLKKYMHTTISDYKKTSSHMPKSKKQEALLSQPSCLFFCPIISEKILKL